MTNHLTPEETLRYSRHLILPQVGIAGQEKLKKARVLIVGAGGLGSPAALYLAAAGIGTIGIVDFDDVEISNLQRQIIHDTGSVGHSKLDSARARLASLNPLIDVVPFHDRLTSSNALDVMSGYHVVLDGSDNFPTRYLINDACFFSEIPNVYGSIFQFDGQASVFSTKTGPCYRCLFREPPPPDLVPSCAEGGVFGVLPGIIGSIQALEAIKLILGIGDTLVGRLLLLDALKLSFREIALKKDPECPLCGEHPTVTGLIDYEHFCGSDIKMTGPEIEVTELADCIKSAGPLTLIDVREPHERAICNIAGSELIAMGTLPQRLDELRDKPNVVLYCHTGVRSLQAVRFLDSAGIEGSRSLRGGIDAWSRQIDPTVPQY